MHLTQHTDYALRVLIYLAILPTSDRARVADIAQSYNISHSHLAKVVMRLQRAGFISSTRGKGGGIHLARQPTEINLGEVIRSMEQEFYIAECFSKDGRCKISPCCKLQPVLREALNAFLLSVGAHTLNELVDTQTEALSKILQPA